MMFFVRQGIAALLLAMHIGAAFSEETSANATAAASMSTAAIPYKREEAAQTGNPLRFIAGFAVCGLVLTGVLYVLKRQRRMLGTAGLPRRHIELLETQRIGPRASLHAVRFANAVYLIAYSEQGITAVASANESGTGTAKEPA